MSLSELLKSPLVKFSTYLFMGFSSVFELNFEQLFSRSFVFVFFIEISHKVTK